MSERYVRLFSLPENLYSVGAPVLVAAGALLRDNQSGRMLAQLKLRNISSQKIKAVTVSVSPFDTVGNSLGGSIRHQYLDLNVIRDEDFGQKVVVALPKPTTRSFTVVVEEVVFATNSLWQWKGEQWESLPNPTLLSAALSDKELEKQYRIQYGNKSQYVPNGVKDVWYCTCGAINHNSENTCHRCNVSLNKLLAFDMDALKNDCEFRLMKEREQKAIAASKARKRRNIAIVAIFALIICAASVLFVSTKRKDSAQLAEYRSAVELMETGRWNEAYDLFHALDGYKDSHEKLSEIRNLQNEKYENANTLLEDGKLIEAYDCFVFLDGYQDSENKANDIMAECGEIYEYAVALMDAGYLAEAYDAFVYIDGYEDSTQQAEIVNSMIADEYDNAISLMDAHKYLDAYQIFSGMPGYKDSAANAEYAYTQHISPILKSVDVGGYVSFGTCEQDNNLSNGNEEIEWLVLAKESNKVLLISRYGLYPQSYNNKRTNVTWESCSLRQWMNDDFLNNAFSVTERSLIPTTTVIAQGREGNNTQDKVFLLNITEIEQYFGEADGLKCQPTKYAVASGVNVTGSNGLPGSEGNCKWWLRTPGKEDRDLAVYVTDTGGIMRIGGMVHITEFAVRPVIWVTIP